MLYSAVKQYLVRALRYIKLPELVLNAYIQWKCGRFPLNAPRFVDFVAYTNHGSAHPEVKRLLLDDLPPKASGAVRLVVISDTHERHREVVVPPGDVFIHCGDILFSSGLTCQRRGLRILADFNNWLSAIPCPERIVVGGNHDWALESLSAVMQRELLSAGTLLHDECVKLPHSGIVVYGNAHSSGRSHNRAWQTEEPTVSGNCADAEVVVTHHCSNQLKEAVLAVVKPKVWASGHDHQGHGAQEEDGILFVNAAIADGKYRPVQPPVVVDIQPKVAINGMCP